MLSTGPLLTGSGPVCLSARSFNLFRGAGCGSRYTGGMMNPRQRTVLRAAIALVIVWVLAITGWTISKNLKVTAEKVRAYVQSVDLSKLSGDARARAIQKLTDMLNKLSPEERRQMRLGRAAESWFNQMTEEEKGQFIEATMPTGFKQMITAFEELSEDKRRRAVDDALKQLRQAQSHMAAGEMPRSGGTNAPVLSPELEAKVRAIGLKSFYSQSSAQTKAELAPVLEELQRAMESGRMMRGR